PLQVLDEGKLESLRRRRRPDHDGNLVEPGLAGRAEASLAGDELESAFRGPDDERLQEAGTADRGRECFERFGVEATARLVGIRRDVAQARGLSCRRSNIRDRRWRRGGRRRAHGCRGEEDFETAAESFPHCYLLN